MKINQEGINLIKQFEGCVLKVYKDIVNISTVGYGHVTTLPVNTKITQDEADRLLQNDLAKFEDGIDKYVKVALTDNQFSALVALSFNIGLDNLKSSTLLKKLNKLDYTGAASEFLKWNRAGGKQVKGLTNRRQAEKELFSS